MVVGSSSGKKNSKETWIKELITGIEIVGTWLLWTQMWYVRIITSVVMILNFTCV